jgi:hypothetical protein
MDREGVVSKATADEAAAFGKDEESCKVAYDESEGIIVSTIFLPICLSFDSGLPQCFETVVVKGMKSNVMKRYSTFCEAIEGHDRFVRDLA